MRKNPLANRAGVYSIRCLPSKKYYIGYSTNVGRRLNTHFNSLRRKKHANRAMQKDFNKFGEDVFVPGLVAESYDSEFGYMLEAHLIYLGGENTYNVVESKKIDEVLREFETDFWKKVAVDGECLTWIGKRSPQGYGVFTCYVEYERIYMQAHRLAYYYAYGDPFSSRVSHICENNYCVEPTHLILGVLNGLPQEMVPKVVKLATEGRTVEYISKKLGVTPTAIREVVRRTMGLKTTDPLDVLALNDSDRDRFTRRCVPGTNAGDCVKFRAALNSSGSPTFCWGQGPTRKNTSAHRVAYFIEHGECPAELTQLCDEPYCVNPAHFKPRD